MKMSADRCLISGANRGIPLWAPCPYKPKIIVNSARSFHEKSGDHSYEEEHGRSAVISIITLFYRKFERDIELLFGRFQTRKASASVA